MLLDSISALIKTGLDKFIPDANVREQVAMNLAKQAYAELELEIKDRADARAREITVRDNVPATLALVTVGGFLALSALLVMNLMYWHNTIPGEALALIGSIVGYLSAKSEMALSYYFGSSKGSDNKTLILDRIVNHKDKDKDRDKDGA